MLKINLEFRKGILFVRLEGRLIQKTVNKFNHEVIDMIKVNGIRNVVINISKLKEIDLKGINRLFYNYEICRDNKGKLIIVGNESEIMNKLKKSHLLNYTKEVNSELDVFDLVTI